LYGFICYLCIVIDNKYLKSVKYFNTSCTESLNYFSCLFYSLFGPKGLCFSLSLIQRKGNKRKIKCYGSVAIRVKPLVTGTSTRLFKAQTASSFLTLGKTLTHASAPMHNPTLYHYTFIVIQTTEGRKDLGNTHLRSLLFFVLDTKKR